MTLRDYLVGRKRSGVLAQVSVMLGVVIVLLVVDPDPASTRARVLWLLAMIVPMSLAAGHAAARTACPRCGFGMINLSLRPRPRQQVNYCPHCTLPLDGPMP